MTDAPKYADRGLEFLPDRVLFHTGANQGDVTVHLITGIRTRQVGDTTMVTLSYLEADASHEFAFKYASVPEPGVRFAHQDLVWRPAGATR